MRIQRGVVSRRTQRRTGAPIEQFGLDDGLAGIDHWFRKPLDLEVLFRELDRASVTE